MFQSISIKINFNVLNLRFIENTKTKIEQTSNYKSQNNI